MNKLLFSIEPFISIGPKKSLPEQIIDKLSPYDLAGLILIGILGVVIVAVLLIEALSD